MVFSSTIFLFLFLPLVLCLYLIVGRKYRNYLLLVASLFFYAWGENVYVLLIIVSIVMNYFSGLAIDWFHRHGFKATLPLLLAIAGNLGLLGFFKYADFVIENLNRFRTLFNLQPFTIQHIHLPIGISFFTFQALTYIVDLYRKETEVQKNPIHLALYISLFPQLLAGPIVRYHDIVDQIKERTTNLSDLSYGIKRFIFGLGKKALLANTLGGVADYIFSLPADKIPASLAWLGAVSYTLQIYYDFSGYSDMAIGLGRMFGFHILENFDYPYISRSIREFWRRWHISLSSWFKDYLYIPLGGSRGGPARTYINLITVFFLCGLWHGASWTFIMWGLFHGCFIVLERSRAGKYLLDRMPWFVQNLYVLLIVTIGWVFFRAESFRYAVGYLHAMVTFSTPALFNSQLFLCLNNELYVVLIVAIICSAPVYGLIEKASASLKPRPSFSGVLLNSSVAICSFCFFGFVFLYSIASIMGGSYHPFLYFRF